MRCFYGKPKKLKKGGYRLEMNYHSVITDAVKEAIMAANVFDELVKFHFNGVNITVHGGSNARAALRDIRRARNGYIDKDVGPYYRPKLKMADRANDRRLHARYKRKNQKEQKKREAEALIHKERVEAKLAGAPAIDVSDPVHWQAMFADKQGYWLIIDYADCWGRLMQLEMLQGKTLEEAAEATADEADIFGASGSVLDMALLLLVKYWKHGEQLRRWHNLRHLGSEKGEEANAKPHAVVSTVIMGG